MMRKVAKSLAATTCAVAMCLSFVGCSCSQHEDSDAAPAPMQVTDTGTVAAPVSETEPFWVLVIGNDTRTGTVEITEPEYADGNARSDTMMMVYIDPTTHRIAIVTIPRDTATDFDGSNEKLNSAYQRAGASYLVTKVSELTGVTPKYYMNTNFVNFEKLIDALGGVNVDIPITMTLDDIVSGNKITLDAGQQDLNGPQALVAARSRKCFADDQDACRQIQDRQILQNAITKAASNPAGAAVVAATMLDDIETNWDKEALLNTVTEFCKNPGDITFTSGTLPYAGGIDPASQLWLITRDEETSRQVIQAAESGADMSAIVPLPSIVAAG